MILNHKSVEIIADIGQAHEGSLGLAHSYVESLAKTGIDVVKFQTHIAAAESSIHEPFRINFSYEDISRFDYWKRMEFTTEQWKGLKEHCEDLNLEFMSTPSCVAAVDLLESIGVKRYKIGSGDTNNLLLIKKIALTEKPILISTGMSNNKDIEQLVKFLETFTNSICLLECSSKYPTEPSDINFDNLIKLKNKYPFEIGFSDHSGTIYPIISAVTLGASIVEFHAVFDNQMFGPDSTSSLNMNEIETLVSGVRYIEQSLHTSSNEDYSNIRSIFGKSLAVNKNLKTGHIITFDDLESKKPFGYGIPASDFHKILNKKLIRNKKKNDFIDFKDLEK